MKLFENITIEVDKEGDIYRAFAYDSATGENIETVKCDRIGGAIGGIFTELRSIANEKSKKE